jgi:hypothetical protein
MVTDAGFTGAHGRVPLLAGFTEQQAEALADAEAEFIEQNLATKRERYCQELWIGGAWLGGFLPIFFVFTAFDLNTINERNTSTHQG